MWKNSLFATASILFGVAVLLLGQLDFLAPYKDLLWQQYALPIGLYGLMLSVSLYAFFFLMTRKLFLKDTGRKLVHLEKQLRDGSLPHELGDRLNGDE